jgi:hypothetical protein
MRVKQARTRTRTHAHVRTHTHTCIQARIHAYDLTDTSRRVCVVFACGSFCVAITRYSTHAHSDPPPVHTYIGIHTYLVIHHIRTCVFTCCLCMRMHICMCIYDPRPMRAHMCICLCFNCLFLCVCVLTFICTPHVSTNVLAANILAVVKNLLPKEKERESARARARGRKRYTHTHTHKFLYSYMYVCVCACMYVYIYIYRISGSFLTTVLHSTNCCESQH